MTDPVRKAYKTLFENKDVQEIPSNNIAQLMDHVKTAAVKVAQSKHNLDRDHIDALVGLKSPKVNIELFKNDNYAEGHVDDMLSTKHADHDQSTIYDHIATDKQLTDKHLTALIDYGHSEAVLSRQRGIKSTNQYLPNDLTAEHFDRMLSDNKFTRDRYNDNPNRDDFHAKIAEKQGLLPRHIDLLMQKNTESIDKSLLEHQPLSTKHVDTMITRNRSIPSHIELKSKQIDSMIANAKKLDNLPNYVPPDKADALYAEHKKNLPYHESIIASLAFRKNLTPEQQKYVDYHAKFYDINQPGPGAGMYFPGFNRKW